jgi:hypothetical protein
MIHCVQDLIDNADAWIITDTPCNIVPSYMSDYLNSNLIDQERWKRWSGLTRLLPQSIRRLQIQPQYKSIPVSFSLWISSARDPTVM